MPLSLLFAMARVGAEPMISAGPLQISRRIMRPIAYRFELRIELPAEVQKAMAAKNEALPSLPRLTGSLRLQPLPSSSSANRRRFRLTSRFDADLEVLKKGGPDLPSELQNSVDETIEMDARGELARIPPPGSVFVLANFLFLLPKSAPKVGVETRHTLMIDGGEYDFGLLCRGVGKRPIFAGHLHKDDTDVTTESEIERGSGLPYSGTVSITKSVPSGESGPRILFTLNREPAERVSTSDTPRTP